MRADEFQKVLLKAAVSSIACDGHIDEREIQEFKHIAENEIYFIGYEYAEELNSYLDYIKKNGINAINEVLIELENPKINPNQKLLLLEVIIRVIEADEKVEPNEIKFMQLVKKNLQLSDELVITKFPKYINYFLNFEVGELKFEFKEHIHTMEQKR